MSWKNMSMVVKDSAYNPCIMAGVSQNKISLTVKVVRMEITQSISKLTKAKKLLILSQCKTEFN